MRKSLREDRRHAELRAQAMRARTPLGGPAPAPPKREGEPAAGLLQRLPGR